MYIKKIKFWKVFLFICLVMIIGRWNGEAKTAQNSPGLDDFLEHCDKYYWSKIDGGVSNMRADVWAGVLGYAYRLQWDKVMQMPEVTQTEKNEKGWRKQQLEGLWWDVKEMVRAEGEKWKNQGHDTGGEQMLAWLDDGFWTRGFGNDPGEMFARIFAVDQPSLIPSVFETEENQSENTFEDVSVEQLALGGWSMKGTFIDTGKKWHRDVVHLNQTKGNHGLEANDVQSNWISFWELSEGRIILKNWKGETFCELYRERKNFWSGIRLHSGRKLRIELFRSQ